MRHRRRGFHAQHRSIPSRACSGSSTAVRLVWRGRLPRRPPQRSTARVAELMEQVQRRKIEGGTGIAHTRWAPMARRPCTTRTPHFSHGGPTRPAGPAAFRWCTTAS